jgi:cytochrome c oxidase subunit IV
MNERSGVHAVSYRTYVLVWLALVTLLGTTIAVAKTRIFLGYSVLGSLLIASVKAGLVLAFFMHLRYEGRFLRRIIFIAVSALTCIIVFTFTDVWYR